MTKKKTPTKKKETEFAKKLKEAINVADEKAKTLRRWKNPGATNIGDQDKYFL